MKKQLFQYMVVFHKYETTESGSRKYIDSTVITPLTTELAKNEHDLVFKLTREIPKEYAENPDDVEISIRNF